MLPFHYIAFRAYSHATEDEEKVRTALYNLFKNAKIMRRESRGYHGNPIIILEGRIERRGDMAEFWEKVSHLRGRLLLDLERRVDDQCNFYMRLDKQEAYLGRAEMTGAKDVIAVRMKVSAHPPTREKCMELLMRFLEMEPDI